MKKEALDLKSDYIRPDIKSVFKNLKTFRKEYTSKQLDVYRVAMNQEEKVLESIRIY